MQQSSYPHFHNTKQVLIKQGKTFGLLIICTWKKVTTQKSELPVSCEHRKDTFFTFLAPIGQKEGK